MELAHNIILAFGGLALLLFGIKMVSTGLELVAGDRMQDILKKATSNRFLAAIVGVIATIVINSSTAVSIITVGFVNAGLMNLTQAIGVLLGINVGTTFSAQLIAFRIDAYAPLFMLIGVIMYLFFKKKYIKNIGYAVLGFGLLFFSITVMGDALRVFRELPAFHNMISAISHPILALLAGFIFTVIVQSSSATMGLLVTMHLNDVPIPFQTSAFIIFGANIGTSITALISAIPASRDSKRTALFHITYDIIGSAVFGTLILLQPSILLWFQTTWYESARQVAMFHTLYNVATLLLLIPFVPQLAKLMKTIVPLNRAENNELYAKKLIFLDSKAMKVPTVVVMNAKLEVCRVGKIAIDNLKSAIESFLDKNIETAEKVIEHEKIINFLHQSITSVLVDITNMPLSRKDSKKVGDMFVVVSDIEQIGDYAENIANYTLQISESGREFTEEAIVELRTLSIILVEQIEKALHSYEKELTHQVPEVRELKKTLHVHAQKFTKNHFRRLKAKSCKTKSGVIFMDMLGDLENCAASAESLARFV